MVTVASFMGNVFVTRHFNGISVLGTVHNTKNRIKPKYGQYDQEFEVKIVKHRCSCGRMHCSAVQSDFFKNDISAVTVKFDKILKNVILLTSI